MYQKTLIIHDAKKDMYQNALIIHDANYEDLSEFLMTSFSASVSSGKT